MVLRMALRIMLGDFIYDNHRDALISDFRGLEINGKVLGSTGPYGV